MLTIRDLLRLALPPGTVLCTDESSAHSRVRAVAMLRASLPAFAPFRGGEVALLSLAQALTVDARLTLPYIVERLSEANVAGVAVIGTVDPEVAHAANRRKLAVLCLPLETELRLVERDVQRLLTDADAQIERRAAQLYSELTQALVVGGGVRGVVALLAERTGQSVACYSASGRLRADAGTNAGRTALQVVAPTPGEQQVLGQRILVRAVNTAGSLALAGVDLDDWDRLALEQGVAVLALELAKEAAVKAAETRVRGDLLRTILSGVVVDPASLQAQATEMGFDLQRAHVATVIEIQHDAPGVVLAQLQRIAKRRKLAMPTLERPAGLVAFCPVDDSHAVRDLVAALAAEYPLTAGVSNPTTTTTAWPYALEEAEQALTLGRQLWGPGSVTVFADLGVYRLLLAQRDAPELWRFYRETLGALLAHDGTTGELLATLEGYFAELGNVSRAAERLHVHRNTLIYRLQRISEITGVDWKRAEDHLALQLALKAHRVLGSR